MTVNPFRRLSAHIIDFVFIVVLRFLFLWVSGAFATPFSDYFTDDGLDEFIKLFMSKQAMGIPFLIAAIIYIEIGIALLPNTLGRHLMGIRVVDHSHGGRPTVSQAWRRRRRGRKFALLINIAMMFRDKEGRHLPDRSADTKVVYTRLSNRQGLTDDAADDSDRLTS